MRLLSSCILGVFLPLAFCAESGMFLCKKLDDEFDRVIQKPKTQPRTRPTARPKQRPRITTPRDEPGELNYKILNGKLEERLRVLEDRISRLEEMGKLNLKFDPVAPGEPCHVLHRNKCFMFIEKEVGTIDLEEAESRCKKLNGELANIYDRNHFRKIEVYLREMMTDDDQMEYFISGMTFKRDTNTVLFRGGSPAPYVPWYSEFDPSMKPGRNQIHVQVNKLETTDSGMYNVASHSRAKSALCEIPKKFITDDWTVEVKTD